jgi:hypothetical protein
MLDIKMSFSVGSLYILLPPPSAYSRVLPLWEAHGGWPQLPSFVSITMQDFLRRPSTYLIYHFTECSVLYLATLPPR